MDISAYGRQPGDGLGFGWVNCFFVIHGGQAAQVILHEWPQSVYCACRIVRTHGGCRAAGALASGMAMTGQRGVVRSRNTVRFCSTDEKQSRGVGNGCAPGLWVAG